jgi:hypothetical protein
MYQTKNIALAASIKDIDGRKGIITGYFAHFDSLDSDGDIIVKGAFAKTIAERGPQSARPRIKHLRNHNITEPIGVLTLLKEDNTGLYYESQPGTHFIGQDTIKMIESGIITEHSFGYDVVKKEQKSNARYLTELVKWEGSSLTAWGANERTGQAMMKSLGKEAYTKMIAERAANVEKFCRNTTATDDTIDFLLIEHKQLTQLLLDISQTSTEPEIKATLPEAEIKSAITNTLKNIFNGN